MSGRDDRRRRERSWERDRDRERPRNRDRDRDRHRHDRDFDRDKERDKDRERERERDRGESHRRGTGGNKGRSRSPRRRDDDRDRRAHGYPGERKGRDLDHHVERRREPLPGRQTREGETPTNLPRDEKTADSTGPKSAPKPSQSTRVNLGPEWDGLEEGEEAPEGGEPMDAENADDAAMMAMLGFGGFGSTKGKGVENNEEGAAKILKERTWRQYMNRKGGFNRPLDKVK